MKIAIAGTGAVGSVIAAYLIQDGKHEVSLLARGAQLAAIRARGLTVESRGRQLESRPRASDDPAELGPQDVILSTVKGYAVGTLAPMPIGPSRSSIPAASPGRRSVPNAPSAASSACPRRRRRPAMSIMTVR